MSRITLLSGSIKTLRCIQCNKYLSVSPIVRSTEGLKCGRCRVDMRTESRAVCFEELLQYFNFPCSFDVHGCKAILSSGQMKKHEASCEFQSVQCPSFKCDKFVPRKEVNHHFRAHHEHDIIKDKTFLINNTICITNKLLVHDKNMFVVHLSVLETGKICVSVKHLDRDCESKNYDLIFSDLNETNVMSSPGNMTSLYSDKDVDEKSLPDLNIKLIRKMVKSQNVYCTIRFTGVLKDDTKSNVLGELECPICTEIMKPPIFMCKIGHSICKVCSTLISLCPSCNSKMEGTRNFALEKISEQLLEK